ncbi:MAG: acyl-CoA dehydrogenase [Pseudorhodobacter sp.]|nr:MAG: acyl-CoA dehydrogenase [Pseudorhodobacter sp.]
MADLFHMLPDEDRAFCDMLSRICADKIAPLAVETDDTGAFVHRQLATLAEAGMMGANLHVLSAQGLLRAVEIVAAACASTASALTAHFLATDSLLLGADRGLQDRLLPAASAGKTLGAFALTERNAGSDPADMKTRATREGDHYRLKGSKCFISNGGVADFVVVYAVTNPEAGHRGISAFVVEKDMPGFRPGRAEKTMGLKGGHVWELEVDCHVPAANRIGPEGSGFKTAMQVLDRGRLEVAAMCIGIAQAALDAATDWAKSRIIGGAPLANRQGIRWQLADMATDLQAARLLALEAARQRQNGERFTQAASMAKLYASEMAHRVTDAALQLHGGYGFTRDFPLERHARDCRIMRIYEGSSEIQRTIIAGHLLH